MLLRSLVVSSVCLLVAIVAVCLVTDDSVTMPLLPPDNLALSVRDPSVSRLPLPTSTAGPESLTLTPDGTHLLTGVLSGEIWSLDIGTRSWSLFARSPRGGRPLGMAFLRDGTLVVADAHLGVLRYSQSGEFMATLVNSSIYPYPNDVAVIGERVVYFTSSSSRYYVEESVNEVMEGGRYGKLLKLDLVTGHVEVVAPGLAFPNGLCLTHDGAALLVVETSRSTISSLDLTTGTLRPFGEQLPTFVDNVSRRRGGGYWVAGTGKWNRVLFEIRRRPLVRRLIARMFPSWFLSRFVKPHAVVARLDDNGKLLGTLEDTTGDFCTSATPFEVDGTLFVGSYTHNFLLSKSL